MIQKFLNLNLVQKNVISKSLGFVLYYTSQCPFNAKYVPIIENVSKEQNIEFKAIHIDTKKRRRMRTYHYSMPYILQW
ncbi:MAG: conjugal transfer protein TraF [Paraclostridium bifermentans]